MVRDVAAGVESSRKVLVVDPDAPVRRESRTACEQDGYQVLEADGAAEAMRQFESSRPNLVLLEVTLPDGAGFDVCRELRKMDPAVPVIMMSSRSDKIDVVVALEIGADDYVAKPLRLRELVARMTAHLRRTRFESAEAMGTRLEFREVVAAVTPRRALKDRGGTAGKVPSREKIPTSFGGYEDPTETRVIDVHIRNLRRKIESQPSRPY